MKEIKKIVTEDPLPLPVPEGLTDSKAILIWNEATIKKFRSLGHRTSLEVCLFTLQRVNKTSAVIDRDGLMIKGEKMDHSHPLLRILQKDLALLNKQWVTLGLNNEPIQFEKFE
ncbi:MAG: hypothetical protein ABSG71_06055 [Thermodesulfobacteriota bacterium]|jgi:hypothetical protein